jgi:hypothetical protein
VSDFQDILDEPDDDEAIETPGAGREAVETPTPTTPEPVAAETAPPEKHPVADTPIAPVAEALPLLPDGFRRDDRGRVHRPDGTIASKAEVAALPFIPPPPPPPPPPEQFVYRASGRKIPMEGAMLAADGSLTVPATQVPLLRQLFAAGVQHNEVYPQERQQFEQRIAHAEAQAKSGGQKYNDASLYLYDKFQSTPDWFLSRVSDPDLRAQLSAEWQREFDYIRRDVGHILKEADLNAPRIQPQQAPDDSQMEAAARSALTEEIEDLLDITPHSAQLYNGEDRQDLVRAFQSRLNAYVEDHDGQLVIDRHALKADFDREVRLQHRVRTVAVQATKDAEKAKHAAAFNAANGRTAVPSTPSRPTPALSGARSSGAPAKTWDQTVNAIWSDDDDDE